MLQITIDEQKADIREVLGFIKAYLKNPGTAKAPPFVSITPLDDTALWKVDVKGASVTLTPLSDFSEITAKSMNREHFSAVWTGKKLELEAI